MVLARFAAIRPFAVRECAAPPDVAEAFSMARRAAQPVAVRSDGHCFAGRSSTTGVVIDVRPMSGVEVDGDRAEIGAGSRLAEVYAALAGHGRTIAAGCGPTVGISGLTLGGGLGILGRRHGLTCDQLLAATLVLPDGRVTEADDDLLWMLRGGGAPGVVTSLVFRTVPAPDSTAFRLVFPARAAAAVLDAWQACLPALDDAMAPSLVITAPDAGDPVVTVFGAGPSDAAVDDLIGRLGVRPLSDERYHGSHPQVKQWLSADADRPDPHRTDPHRTDPNPADPHQADPSPADPNPADRNWAYLHSEFFRDLVPAERLIARLEADRRPGEERELDFSPWGGAYNRVAAGATAFPHRDARFLLKQTATVAPGERPGPWLDDSFALTRPYGTGGAYPNFPDPTLATEEPYYLGNTARRARVRARYDPEGIVA